MGSPMQISRESSIFRRFEHFTIMVMSQCWGIEVILLMQSGRCFVRSLAYHPTKEVGS